VQAARARAPLAPRRGRHAAQKGCGEKGARRPAPAPAAAAHSPATRVAAALPRRAVDPRLGVPLPAVFRVP
jgi:hypothetical protein